MAGKPLTAIGVQKLHDHVETIETMLSNGDTLEQVRAAMGVSKTAMDRWLGSDTGIETYSRARSFAAHGMADEVRLIADAVPEDRNAIAKAKLRVETRQWTAGLWNKTYLPPQQQGNNVTVNVNSLHLGALRQTTAAQPPEALPHEVQDADWCDVEGSGKAWCDE